MGRTRSHHRRGSRLGRAILALAAGAVSIALAGCGGEPLELTPVAAEGRQIANSRGCASCHGKNGQGVTAPSWQGLYLEPVPLADGTTVIADDEYLYTSITDPQRQIVDDFTIKMPANDLTDDEIDRVIAYIRELG